MRGGRAEVVRRPVVGRDVGLRILGGVALVAVASSAWSETWRGLTIAPEHRGSPYDKKRDYPYPQSVEQPRDFAQRGAL